eukprot:gene12320-biopygen22964
MRRASVVSPVPRDLQNQHQLFPAVPNRFSSQQCHRNRLQLFSPVPQFFPHNLLYLAWLGWVGWVGLVGLGWLGWVGLDWIILALPVPSGGACGTTFSICWHLNVRGPELTECTPQFHSGVLNLRTEPEIAFPPTGR